MKLRILFNVGLVGLIACKKKDDGELGRLPDADVTFVSDGAGPENEGPLEPAVTGFRTAREYNWQRWTGPIDAGRDEVLAKEISGGNQPLAPSWGQGVGLYRQTNDGLVIHALDAPLDDEVLPILMVPETVRVGMIWESEYGDGENVNRMEVVRHQSIMLPTGPADAWGIAEYDSLSGYEYVSTVRWYAEGIGRIGTGNSTEWSPDFGYDEMVFPHEPQVHDEPGLVRAPLVGAVPMPDIGNYVYEMWGISGAVIEGVLYAYVDGEIPAYGYTSTQESDLCAQLGSPPSWSTSTTGCPTHTVWKENPYDPSSGWEFEAPIDNAAQFLPGTDLDLDLDAIGAVTNTTLTGWMTDGRVYTLELDAWGAGPPQFRVWDKEANPSEVPPRLVTDAIPMRDAWLSWRQRWIGPTRVDAGDTVHFAILGEDGQVFKASLDDERIYGFEAVGILPGAASIVVTDTERLVYSITTDGRVYRLTIDQTDGDVAIDALGAVRVEEPGGGYEFKGVIGDPARPTDVWVGAIATSATSVPYYETGIFLAHLEEEPVPLVTAASLSVTSADTTGGVAVCWKPTDEPFDGTDWTFRGDPAFVVGPVGPDGNCAIVAAPVTVADPPEWAFAERAMQATIPGVGRVSLGHPVSKRAGFSLFPSAAVLHDGRVIDSKGVVFDKDGFPVTSRFNDNTSNTTAWPHDLGGYGLWMWPGIDTPSTEIVNVGGGIPKPECPTETTWNTCYYAGAVVGGGILMGSPPPSPMASSEFIYVVRPDGSLETLPPEQGAAGGVLLEDGRVCGVDGFPREMQCVDRTGAVETSGVLPGEVQPMNDQLWPLTDGTFLVCNHPDYGPAMRFDPTTMTVTVLDARGMISPMTSPDGRVYAVAPSVDGFTNTVVEITPAGVTDIADIGTNTVVLPIDGVLLVGPDWTRLERP